MTIITLSYGTGGHGGFDRKLLDTVSVEDKIKARIMAQFLRDNFNYWTVISEE